jgi:hypothetical protein
MLFVGLPDVNPDTITTRSTASILGLEETHGLSVDRQSFADRCAQSTKPGARGQNYPIGQPVSFVGREANPVGARLDGQHRGLFVNRRPVSDQCCQSIDGAGGIDDGGCPIVECPATGQIKPWEKTGCHGFNDGLNLGTNTANRRSVVIDQASSGTKEAPG